MAADRPFLVAGDALDGLLTDWCGPVLAQHASSEEWEVGVIVGLDDAPPENRHGTFLVCRPDGWAWSPGAEIMSCQPEELRLDTRRRETRDRLRDVLGRELRCPDAPECSASRTCPVNGWSCPGCRDCTLPLPLPKCPKCSGSDYLRPPHRLGWITDAEEAVALTPIQAAAVWWCCVERVARGMGPLEIVYGPRHPLGGSGMTRREPVCHFADWATPKHHRIGGLDDAGILREGCALLDPDGSITLPHPDGPVRIDKEGQVV